MARTLLDRLGLPPEDVLVVGDRLLTDVALAHSAGMDAALVLTGATRREDVGSVERPPEFVLDDLRELVSEGDDG
jgi:ribonucleotide monophosphatase NagD (HAD superfamily)